MDENGLSLEQFLEPLRARRKQDKSNLERRRRGYRDYLERAIRAYPSRTAAAEKSYRILQINGLKSIDQVAELMRKVVGVKPTRYRKTAKAVAAFTDRLDMVANEIMADPIYVPDREFLDLPSTLYRYADYIRERYRHIQQSRRGRPLPRAQLYTCLRATVWKETGKEHLDHLGNLLLAVEFLARKTLKNTNPPRTDFHSHLKMNAHRYPAPSFLRKK